MDIKPTGDRCDARARLECLCNCTRFKIVRPAPPKLSRRALKSVRNSLDHMESSSSRDRRRHRSSQQFIVSATNSRPLSCFARWGLLVAYDLRHDPRAGLRKHRCKPNRDPDNCWRKPSRLYASTLVDFKRNFPARTSSTQSPSPVFPRASDASRTTGYSWSSWRRAARPLFGLCCSLLGNLERSVRFMSSAVKNFVARPLNERRHETKSIWPAPNDGSAMREAV